MFFRNNIITAAAIATLALAASCKKFITIDNPSTVTLDREFETVSSTSSALTGVYALMAGSDGYGQRLANIFPQSADDFKAGGNYSALDRRGIGMYGVAPVNNELPASFRRFYMGIERANLCIKYIPLSPAYLNGSEQQKKDMRRMLGEAYTLRAQFYYELVRNWGDLPFHDVPAADLADFSLPKTDRDSIYDRVLGDLKIAEEYVPWRTESTDAANATRITKAAVKGIRARIALTRGGYSLRFAHSIYGQQMARPADYLDYYKIARDECYDIIQRASEHDLTTSYENVFRALHSNIALDVNHEIILCVGAYGNNSSSLGYYNGVRHAAGSRYSNGGGGNIAIPTYFYEFDSIADVRRDITIGSYEIDASSNKILNTAANMTDGKFRRSWTNIGGAAQTLNIEWPLLRFSDVLLMFAEAENELNNGPTAEAIAAYEKVRKRAYAGNLDRMGATPTNKNDFFTALVKERYLEFGGEGIRKYDLIRWNLLYSKILETRAKLSQMMLGEGRYVNVPAIIYVKANSYNPENNVVAEENTLSLYGGVPSKVFFEQGLGGGTTPAGYTAKAWRNSINLEFISGDNSGFARYFEPNKRELFPLPSDIINENNKLKNDCGCF
ncbi:RagB/SusD family nutrient uptake outer membrane protein [Filimonas effusa]|uniref:RagB/SusD family nutrient uptake outer membrane protein n=2 Tax=Filimonas effusa TaxID=2508721 RepID=A0A4Q1D646_9BACT|nr:RagB/SusD family nutrient uptake outer membrane protein [Filimonas effusa]